MHFLLVNLYGQPYTKEGAKETKAIPLKLTLDLEEIPTRNTVEEVYNSCLLYTSHVGEGSISQCKSGSIRYGSRNISYCIMNDSVYNIGRCTMGGRVRGLETSSIYDTVQII